MRAIVTHLRVLAAVAALLLEAAPLHAQLAAATISLETHPETLTLGHGERATVLVVARNESRQLANNVLLSPVPCRGIRLSEIPLAGDALPPGNARSWLVELERTGQEIGGELNFQLSFVLEATEVPDATKEGREQLPAVSGITTTKVALAGKSPRPIADILEVALEATTEAVDDYRSADLLLVVRNKSEFEVTLPPPTIEHPAASPSGVEPDFTVQPKLSLSTMRLQPREQRVIVYEVGTPGRRVPGSRIVAVKVDPQWQEYGQTQRGSLIATHTFELGVFGESAILAAIGVPAFFLLPGFLCLTAFTAVIVRYWHDLPENLKLSAVEYGAVSVALSFLAVPVYAWLMNVNYLEGYSLTDVGLLWFGSLATGLLAAGGLVLLNLGVRTVKWVRDRLRAGWQFQDNDTAPEVIEKLAASNASVMRPRTKVTENGVESIVLQLDGANPGWICPVIHCEFTELADDVFRDQFETRFDTAVQNDQGLYKLLRRKSKQKRIRLAFDATSAIPGPRQMQHQPEAGKDPLVVLG